MPAAGAHVTAMAAMVMLVALALTPSTVTIVQAGITPQRGLMAPPHHRSGEFGDYESLRLEGELPHAHPDHASS